VLGLSTFSFFGGVTIPFWEERKAFSFVENNSSQIKTL